LFLLPFGRASCHDLGVVRMRWLFSRAISIAGLLGGTRSICLCTCLLVQWNARLRVARLGSTLVLFLYGRRLRRPACLHRPCLLDVLWGSGVSSRSVLLGREAWQAGEQSARSLLASRRSFALSPSGYWRCLAGLLRCGSTLLRALAAGCAACPSLVQEAALRMLRPPSDALGVRCSNPTQPSPGGCLLIVGVGLRAGRYAQKRLLLFRVCVGAPF
jgi:hypothetical protein